MSYMALIPAVRLFPKEHLTLVWCDKEYDNLWGDMTNLAIQLTDLYCRGGVEGWIYSEAYFTGGPVALVALPHDIHVMRHTLLQYDQSGRETWIPHITAGPTPLTRYHGPISFTHVEWRK